MTDEFVIEASGLEKAYGSVRVLAGADIQVARGSVFSLLGPNGAGKTTTVKILSTLVRPDAGSARVAGFDVLREQRKVRRVISLTGQSVALDPRLTGAENLRMMGGLWGLPRRESASRADALIERFDLVEAASRRVSTYSGGMRRRLDLAAGLVGRPSVVFLDEPTTGLDPRSRRMMWEVVSGLADAGITIFLTTQYLEEADELADRVAVLDDGRIVAEGTPAELKARVAEHRLDIVAADDAAFTAITERLGSRVTSSDAPSLTLGVPTDGSAAMVRALLDEADPDRAAVARFELHSATLDDVFLALTGRDAASREADAPAATPESDPDTDTATGSDADAPQTSKEVAGV